MESREEDSGLIAAVRAGDLQKVGDALAAGASPDAIAENGLSALALAVQANKDGIVSLLLKSGAKPNAPGNGGLVAFAVGWGNEAVLEQLLLAGAPLYSPEDLRKGNRDNILVMAVGKRSVRMVSLLLEFGADPNGTEPLARETALFGAAALGDIQIMQVLIDANCTVDFKNRRGTTALMTACGYSQGDAVRLLLKHGANPCAKDNYGDSAIGYAALSENPEVGNLLPKCSK